METPKLSLLFFLTFLAASNSIIAMQSGHRGLDLRTGQYNGYLSTDSSSRGEGKIKTPKCQDCLARNPEYMMLECGHQICTECAEGILSNSFRDNNLRLLRCSDCKADFTENDYGRMESFASNDVANIRRKIADAAAPKRQVSLDAETKSWISKNAKLCPNCKVPIEKNNGCDHMTCKNCPHEFCWLCLCPRKGYNHSCIASLALFYLKQSAKFGIPIGLGCYGLYKFFAPKKASNTKPTDKVQESTQSWFSRVKQTIREKVQSTSKSDILVPTLASAGLFALLTKTHVNLSIPAHNWVYNTLGGKFCSNIKHTKLGNMLFKTIENRHAANAVASITGGLLVGHVYKLLDGSSTRKKKPIIKIKK